MSEPIRVLYVISNLLEGQGGIQGVVMSIYRHLNHKKVQIDFVVHSDGTPSFVPAVQAMGGRIYQAPRPKKEGFLAYIRWWNRFFKEHPEYKIVHGHMRAYISFYLWVAKRHGCTTIAHCHNDEPHIPLWKKCAEKISIFPLRWVADYQFACSVQAGKYFFGKRTVQKSSFRFIPNARDTQEFSFNEKIRQTVRQHLGLTDKFVIGHAGRFNSQKNHIFLVQVFEEIYRQNPQARLLLLGTGPLKSKIQQQVKDAGLENAALFMDVVPNPADYYSAMDVFLFPSLFEGLGMVLTEAQISGLPCVFSANLPWEIEIAPELCHRIDLAKSVAEWAQLVLAQAGVKRVSRATEAMAKGFEITALVNRLENFYLALVNEKDRKVK